MTDKYGYITHHANINKEKLDLCEKIFSKCEFDETKYTIIIPEYRRPGTVKEALLSALNQDYKESYEVLLTSDGQSKEEDEVERIIRELSEEYSNISYYRNTTNVGMFGNWNNCISNAKGKWIVVLPDDDLLSPYFLSTVDRFICDNDFTGMIGSKPHKIVGKVLYNPNDFSKPDINCGVTWIDNYGAFFDDGVSVTGMTFDKESILSMGGFQEEFYPVSDSVCMINYALNNKLVRLHADISAYRIDDNVSQSKGVLEKILQYAARMKETVSETNPELEKFYRRYKSEIMHDYIVNAEHTWGTTVRKSDVTEEVKCGFEYSKIKYYMMKVQRKIMKMKHR